MTGLLNDQQMTEYEALGARAGFVRLEGRTYLEMSGSDRAKFLHNFCTNDITSLASGQGCEAFITNVQGRVLALAHVACGSERLRLECAAAAPDQMISHFDKYLIADDVQLKDLSPQYCLVVIAGAESPDRLAKLFGAEMSLQPCDHLATTLGDATIWVQSTRALAGSPCFFASLERSHADEFCRRLQAAGATPCSPETWDIRRIEAGFPEYGRDISEKNFPQEVERNETAISFTKGCYLGQETVARIDAVGHVNWQLVGVRCGGGVPASGHPINAGDAQVGRVTSACYSPRLRTPLALAYVRREQVESGAALSCGGASAEVVDLPPG